LAVTVAGKCFAGREEGDAYGGQKEIKPKTRGGEKKRRSQQDKLRAFRETTFSGTLGTNWYEG